MTSGAPNAVGETACHAPMSYAEDSPVRISAKLASELEYSANARDCLQRRSDSLTFWDQTTSSWRTSQLSFTGEWALFWGPWPRSGMTRNGIAYQRPPSALVTAETESGSWPTPTARDWKDGTAAACRNVPANGLLGRVVHESSRRQTDSPESGSLNPVFVEWLMGYPLGWTDLGASATRSSRKSRNGSAAASSKPKND
jgi:hypothetical protein